MKTYLIRFDSESGDHINIGTFTSPQEPSQGQLDRLARAELAGYIDDNTLFGSFDVTEIGDTVLLPPADMDALPLKRL